MYRDGSQGEVTSDATWPSILPGFASVANAAGARGAVTGLAVGATTLRRLAGC